MTAIEVTNAIVIATIPIIVARLVVGMTYERRQSRLWTFALPTLALGILLLRVAISRNFSQLVSPDDWAATASFAGVLLTQLAGTIYQWWPPGAAAS